MLNATGNGINKGLHEIACPKWSISTVASYRLLPKLFEAVGLHDEVANLCFRGVVGRCRWPPVLLTSSGIWVNLSKRAGWHASPLDSGRPR